MTSRRGISFLVWVYVALAFGISVVGFGKTVYVNGGCGDDGWSGESDVCAEPDGPKATIQAAIDAAADGDTVIVTEGTYKENIFFYGKNIQLTSTDPEDWATVIQGDGSQSVVTFEGSESADCKLFGLTVTSGTGIRI